MSDVEFYSNNRETCSRRQSAGWLFLEKNHLKFAALDYSNPDLALAGVVLGQSQPAELPAS